MLIIIIILELELWTNILQRSMIIEDKVHVKLITNPKLSFFQL